MATAFGSQLRSLRGKQRERWRDLSPMRKREAKMGLLFISPWIIGVLLFSLFPFIASFVLSFTRYNVVEPPQWRGLDNYTKILTDDPLFWKSLGNTSVLCRRLGRDPHPARFRAGFTAECQSALPGYVAHAVLCAVSGANRSAVRRLAVRAECPRRPAQLVLDAFWPAEGALVRRSGLRHAGIPDHEHHLGWRGQW